MAEKLSLAIFPYSYGDAGVPVHHRDDWDVLLASAAQIERYHYAGIFERLGFGPDEIRRLENAGIPIPSIPPFAALGLRAETFRRYADEKIRDPAAIRALVDAEHDKSSGMLAYPRSALTMHSRLYPGLWQIVDRFPDDFRMRLGLFTATGLFTTTMTDAKVAEHILSQNASLPADRGQAIQMEVLAQWRQTQGIYAFDETLFDELLKTDVPTDYPVEPLRYLPEPIVYIPLGIGSRRGIPFAETTAFGAWVGILSPDTGPIIAVHTGRPRPSTYLFPSTETLDISAIEEISANNADEVQPLARILSLALYLSSPDADLLGEPRTIVPKKTKHGHRHFPAAREQVWQVGMRLGPALRHALSAASTSDHLSSTTRKPHIRKAHWHRFRYGPRSQPQQLRARWLAPIAINLTNLDDLPAVIRPVGGADRNRPS